MPKITDSFFLCCFHARFNINYLCISVRLGLAVRLSWLLTDCLPLGLLTLLLDLRKVSWLNKEHTVNSCCRRDSTILL